MGGIDDEIIEDRHAIAQGGGDRVKQICQSDDRFAFAQDQQSTDRQERPGSSAAHAPVSKAISRVHSASCVNSIPSSSAIRGTSSSA